MSVDPVHLAVIKTATITLLVFLASHCFLWGRRQVFVLAGCFALSIAAYQAATLTRVWSDHSPHAIFVAGAIAVPFFFWVFSRSLFDDRFQFRLTHFAILLAVEILSFANHASSAHSFLRAWSPEIGAVLQGLFPQVFSLVFVGLAVFAALKDRQSDLIEGRRLLRTGMVISIGLYGGVVLLTEVFLKARGGPPSLMLELVNSTVILCLVVFFALRILGPRDDLFWERASEPRAPTAPVSAPAAPAAEDPLEAEIVPRLTALMQGEALFREEGLTIRVLAGRLATPEYRLRRVINRRLGYRNFNDYLNRYRVEEACALLADPAQKSPVLRIAMDLGYGSLATFNRAFRTVTGSTPTEYRARALAAGQDEAASAPDAKGT